MDSPTLVLIRVAPEAVSGASVLARVQRVFSKLFVPAIVPFVVPAPAFASNAIVLVALFDAVGAPFRIEFRIRRWPPDLVRVATAILILIVWALPSAIWSLGPERSAVEAGKLLVECAAGLVLIPAFRPRRVVLVSADTPATLGRIERGAALKHEVNRQHDRNSRERTARPRFAP